MRRAVALALDILLLSVVLSIVGLIAFKLTEGRVQYGGLLPLFSQCGERVPVPSEVDPSPDFDKGASICTGGALPFANSKRWLIVGMTTYLDTGRWSSTHIDVPLSTSNKPIEATDLAWLGWISVFAYFAIGLATRGQTLGMRLMGIRLFTNGKAQTPGGVPIPLLFARTCIAIAGLMLPALAFVCAFSIRDPRLAYTALFVGIVGPIAWTVTNVVFITSGRDPVYDRLTGLTMSVSRR